MNVSHLNLKEFFEKVEFEKNSRQQNSMEINSNYFYSIFDVVKYLR